VFRRSGEGRPRDGECDGRAPSSLSWVRFFRGAARYSAAPYRLAGRRWVWTIQVIFAATLRAGRVAPQPTSHVHARTDLDRQCCRPHEGILAGLGRCSLLLPAYSVSASFPRVPNLNGVGRPAMRRCLAVAGFPISWGCVFRVLGVTDYLRLAMAVPYWRSRGLSIGCE
jgi:hypothetical protein